MTTDLFGHPTPERVEQCELDAPGRGMAYALAQLKERWQRARTAARLRPNDMILIRREAVARREYFQARDFGQSMSHEEVAAEARARRLDP